MLVAGLALVCAFGSGGAEAQTVAERVAAEPRLARFDEAVRIAGLGDLLSGPGPFTLLAPTNEAFARVPQPARPRDAEALRAMLLMHAIEGRRLRAIDFPRKPTRFTPLLEAARLCIDGRLLTAADGIGRPALFVAADLQAENGIVHLIDRVLLPGDPPDCG